MPYARIDDRYDDHKKVKKALRTQPVAVAIHVMAITYCNRHVTDGVLERDWIDEKLALTPLRYGQRSAVLKTLLDTGLLEPHDDEHYLVHDFLEWNLSRAQRKALAEQGSKGGKAKPGHKPTGSDGSSPGLSEGLSHSGKGGLSTPTPTPTPTPREERAANAALVRTETEKATEEDRASCRLFYELGRERNTKMKVPRRGSREQTAALKAMRLLRERDGQSVGEIQQLIRWLFTDQSEDAVFWGSTIQAPSGLRKNFSAAWSKMTAASSNVVHIRAGKSNASDMLQRLDAADAAEFGEAS